MTKLGVALPVFDLESLAPISAAVIADQARAAEASGFDSIWLMDHIFVMQHGHRVSGHEPMTTLGYLAAVTNQTILGALVLCNSFRHPAQLAREAAALVDISGQRFVLGLGCGSQPLEHEAFGFPYRDRVSRLEETLAVLRPILTGDRVDFSGRFLEIRDGSIVTTQPPPPIWLAATGPRMMRLAARYCDGWVGDFYGPDTTQFRRELEALEHALREVKRPREQMEVVVGLQVLLCNDRERDDIISRADRLGPPSERPVEQRVLIGDVDRVKVVIQEYWDSGADHVVLILSPWHFGRFTQNSIREAATIVERVRSS